MLNRTLLSMDFCYWSRLRMRVIGRRAKGLVRNICRSHHDFISRLQYDAQWFWSCFSIIESRSQILLRHSHLSVFFFLFSFPKFRKWTLLLMLDTHCSLKKATTWQNQQNGCATSEDSDQPGHPPSLIRVFAVRMKKAWVLRYPLSAQRILIRLGGSKSSLGAHSFCWFWHVLAQIDK